MLYHDETNFLLYHNNALEQLAQLPPDSVDMVFAEPPFFLSSDGILKRCGTLKQVREGKRRYMTLDEKHAFNRSWMRLCYQLLHENGTIWIAGTMNNIGSLGLALQQEGFRILNNIVWQKTNPPPNLSCHFFVHSTETFLWAKKKNSTKQHTFHYDFLKEHSEGSADMDVWTSPLTPKTEKTFGKHPAQKPLWLMERIISSCTNEENLVLDPFCGTATSGIASYKLGRRYIGIDNVSNYLDIAERRLREYKLNDFEQLTLPGIAE